MMKPMATTGWGKQLAVALITFAGPVSAQQFSLPSGCTAFVTIQMTSCTVSHHYRCVGDPPDEKWRVDLDEEGMTYVGRTNSEAQWLESFHILSGHSEQMGDAVEEMSLSSLFENGVDTWDFETTSAEIGTNRYVGFDRLTGETVEIDGVELLRTEYELVAYGPDGSETWRSSGREFASAEWRMFLSGVSRYVTSRDTFDSDDTPVEFIFPGEEGFMSASPKFGCGMQMSSFATAD